MKVKVKEKGEIIKSKIKRKKVCKEKKIWKMGGK